MTTTTFAEGAHTGEFLISECDQPNYSRDVVTLISGQNLGAGTVLGKITLAGATAAAFAGNTGTGTVGTITVSAGAKPGVYKVVMVEPGTNVGTYTVEDPDGVTIGTGVVASAFSAGGLAFTISDATDFVAGDGFNITVAAGSSKYTQFNQDASNGSQHAAGILYAAVDASGGDVTIAVIIARDAIVNGDLLVWPSDIEAGEKTAAIAELKAIGILVR